MATPRPNAVAMSASAMPPVIAVGRAEFCAAEHPEAADHPRDRAEQTEQRRERDRRVEDRQPAIESLQLPIRRAQHRLAE